MTANLSEGQRRSKGLVSKSCWQVGNLSLEVDLVDVRCGLLSIPATNDV